MDDFELRQLERKLGSSEVEVEDILQWYAHMNRLSSDYRLRYPCLCAAYHEIESCQVNSSCNDPRIQLQRFFCEEPEECALCSTCKSMSHNVHNICESCGIRGCSHHFAECLRCERKMCPTHLNDDDLCRTIRIESSMPGILPHGWMRGCEYYE